MGVLFGIMSEETAKMREEIELESKGGRAIAWYRTKIDSTTLKKMHQRSDLRGFLQTFGWLATMGTTMGLALYSFGHWNPLATVGLTFLHGMVCAFMINGVHELCHNTVFKSQWLNAFFVRVLSFFGWINFRTFESSHLRHHRYTLHQPDDLEVTVPIKLMLAHMFKQGIINPIWAYHHIGNTIKTARGQFQGEWENRLFPTSDPENQKLPIYWARTMLIGHLIILVISIIKGWWLLPVLVSANQWYGGWLFWFCNNTQHVGMRDAVPDFRKCCRTFTLNPVFQFLYWHMNYHIEHHMYAAVPCYNLGKLHKAIKHDLPPITHGLVPTWKEILGILKKQEQDPTYQYDAPCPVAVLRERPKAAVSQVAEPANT